MANFSYVARDSSGAKQTGTITANSPKEAAANLIGRGLFPTEVKPAGALIETRKIRRVPAQLLSTTFAQLADLLRSGVPLLRAIEVIGKQTSHGGLKTILDEVHHHVEEGASLADAFARYPRVFGDMAVSMVHAGVEGAFLEEALTRVAEFTESQDDLKKRTIGAVVYPVFLAVVLTIVVSVIIVFFVPMFSDIFQRLRERGELPALTEWLLWFSDTVRSKWGVGFIAAFVAAIVLVKRWAGTDSGRIKIDRWRIRAPLFGPILLSLAVARFCRVLGTLLHNGVPILRSLEISRTSSGNQILAQAIATATENISAGHSLAEPLRVSGYFPSTVVEMISVAEQANNLENVLISIADGLEKRTWRKLDLAVRLAEPMLLLILASVILVIVLALMIPILKMSSTV